MARKPRVYTPIEAPEAEPTPAELVADGVVDLKAAAVLCGHGVTWVTEQVEAKRLPAFKLSKKWVIPRRALIAFLAERMQAAS